MGFLRIKYVLVILRLQLNLQPNIKSFQFHRLRINVNNVDGLNAALQ